MQSAAVLSSAVPGIGTPTDVIKRYDLELAQYISSLNGYQRFTLDVSTISVYNERQAELREKRREEGREKMSNPDIDYEPLTDDERQRRLKLVLGDQFKEPVEDEDDLGLVD